MSVLPALLLRLKNRRNDHLRIALAISAAIHACVLLWRPAQPRPAAVPAPSFDIVLVNAHSDLPPLHPSVLAQADLNGGGEMQSGLPTSPLPRTSLASPDEIVLAAMRKRQAELEKQQLQLYTQLLSDERTEARRTDPEYFLDSPDAGQDTREQQSMVLNAQISALREQIERYNAQPRQHFAGPSAKADDQAAYLDAWRARIEKIGTEHYPEQARGRIHGDLQLTVYIRRDGELERIEIDRPSPHAVLNLAAQRIVRLAAPFAPLPESLSRSTDVLAITRTWHFTNNQLETAQP